MLCRWVKVLIVNTESCIKYVGWLPEPIKVESGIGLGIGLHSRPRTDGTQNKCAVKGINLPDFPTDENIVNAVQKLVMYADDVTLFLRDKADLENILSLIKDFSLISSLKINRNKTEAIWLGSLKQCADTHIDF